jgi:hypothetical protein
MQTARETSGRIANAMYASSACHVRWQEEWMWHRESSLYAHRNTMSEAHMAVMARSSARSGDSNIVGRSGWHATVPGEGYQ